MGQGLEFEWGAQLGGEASQSGHVTTIGSSEETYSNGILNGEMTVLTELGTITLQSAIINSPFVVETSSQGTFSWVSYLEVAIFTNVVTDHCIASDEQGNSYVALTVSSFEDWDIIPGPDSLTMSLYQDALIAKFSPQGEVIWARSIGDGSFSREEPRDIAVDSQGNVYTCGYFKGSPDFDPDQDTLIIQGHAAGSGFIHKMNSDGELLWTGRIGDAGNAESMALDADGNCYITGQFEDTVDIAPGPDTLILEPYSPALDGYLIKLNPDGYTEWVNNIGGFGGHQGTSVTVNALGNILACGFFGDTIFPLPGQIEGLGNFGNTIDMYVYEFDPDGTVINAVTIGGSGSDYARKIEIDTAGNIYLKGEISIGNPTANVDLDPGPDTAWSQDFGITHEFIAKYDPAMNLIWAMPGNGAADFAVGAGQELYLTGTFTDTIDLDPGPVQQLYISEGGTDMYVMKLNQDSLLTTNGEKGKMEKSEKGLAVSVFPNPSAGSFTVELSSENSDVRYQISDLAGRGIQAGTVKSSRFTIELESEPGVYLLRIWNEDAQAVDRLVKK